MLLQAIIGIAVTALMVSVFWDELSAWTQQCINGTHAFVHKVRVFIERVGKLFIQKVEMYSDDKVTTETRRIDESEVPSEIRDSVRDGERKDVTNQLSLQLN